MFGPFTKTPERYALPLNVTRGLGWTREGTIVLGSTTAYLSLGVPMPENDGNLYAWNDDPTPYGTNYVVQVGTVDMDGNLTLTGTPPRLTWHADEIVAVKSGETLFVPENKALIPGIGKFIAVSDASSPTYIGGVDEDTRMDYIAGEGAILDNVIVSNYSEAGVLLEDDTSEQECIIWNSFFGLDSVGVKMTAYTLSTLQLINSTIDGILEISTLNPDVLDIRNNKIMALNLKASNMDLSNVIRNNYISIVDDDGSSNILPVDEPIGFHWYGLETLEEMEEYRGNIVGASVLPDKYGYLRGIGKVNLGSDGSVPYLSPPTKLTYERYSEGMYKFLWEKASFANDYRLNASTSFKNLRFIPPYALNTGDSDVFVLETQNCTLVVYPANNDGNKDGAFDTLFDLTKNVLWYFSIQSQFLLGGKLLCHLSAFSDILALPTYNTGTSVPSVSRGLMFPVQIKDGKFRIAEGDDSVKSGIFQTVMTNVGERVLHEHGAGLRAFLFEGEMDVDLFDVARSHLKAELEAVEPRIQIDSVIFRNAELQNGTSALIVTISYTNKESGTLETFSTGIRNV